MKYKPQTLLSHPIEFSFASSTEKGMGWPALLPCASPQCLELQCVENCYHTFSYRLFSRFAVGLVPLALQCCVRCREFSIRRRAQMEGKHGFEVVATADQVTLTNTKTKESVLVSLVEGGATLQITLLSADNHPVDTIQHEGNLFNFFDKYSQELNTYSLLGVRFPSSMMVWSIMHNNRIFHNFQY